VSTGVHQGRAARAVAAGALAAAVLAGCSGPSAPAGPPASSAPASSAAQGGAAGTAIPSATSGGGGCPADGGGVPAGAGSAPTADLDRDGEPDVLWLSDAGGQRTLGVTTASGATFSTTFESAAPQAARALGQRLGGSDPGVVLLDTGRSVQLYTTAGCALAPTTDERGRPWSFDLGFTGYGTGVGCADLGQGLQLVGLLAEDDGEGTSTVTRTPIELTDDGRTARGGAAAVVVERARNDDPVVEQARSVSCGDQAEGAGEPQP